MLFFIDEHEGDERFAAPGVQIDDRVAFEGFAEKVNLLGFKMF